jgi:hypothetical protein
MHMLYHHSVHQVLAYGLAILGKLLSRGGVDSEKYAKRAFDFAVEAHKRVGRENPLVLFGALDVMEGAAKFKALAADVKKQLPILLALVDRHRTHSQFVYMVWTHNAASDVANKTLGIAKETL